VDLGRPKLPLKGMTSTFTVRSSFCKREKFRKIKNFLPLLLPSFDHSMAPKAVASKKGKGAASSSSAPPRPAATAAAASAVTTAAVAPPTAGNTLLYFLHGWVLRGRTFRSSLFVGSGSSLDEPLLL
jgi:hypothetical protein